jgi:hypothetical protein
MLLVHWEQIEEVNSLLIISKSIVLSLEWGVSWQHLTHLSKMGLLREGTRQWWQMWDACWRLRIFLVCFGGGEAVNCVVYILNRETSNSTGGKTPYELWIGNTPTMNHLRTFGYVVHVVVTKLNLKKLDDRSRLVIFVGYEPGLAAYRCYDPNTKCVNINRGVIFDEEAVWNWLVGQATEMDFEFIVDGETEVIQTTETSLDVVDASAPLVIDVGGQNSEGVPGEGANEESESTNTGFQHATRHEVCNTRTWARSSICNLLLG